MNKNRIIFYIGIIFIICSFILGVFFSAEKLQKISLLKSAEPKIKSISEKIKSNVIETNYDKFSLLPCQAECDYLPQIIAKIKEAVTTDGLISFQIVNFNQQDILNAGGSLSQKYNDMYIYAAKNGLSTSIENPEDTKTNLVALSKISAAGNSTYFIFLRFDYSENPGIVLTDNIFNSVVFGLFVIGLLLSIIYSSGVKDIESNFEELEKVKEELRLIKSDSNSQNQFIANFTHELRTPLNSIIGFSGMLKDETLGSMGNPEYIKFASEINNSGIHLLSIINDILDFSKAESGKLKVNLVETDVTKILRQCLGIIAPRAAESKVDLLENMLGTNYVILADGKRFKQVVLNLLSNAVKFTPEGGSVSVSVFPEITQGKLFVEIKDTGVGIAEKDIPVVLTLFGQVENKLSRKYEGTGIGLPFSKKLTNLMGGDFLIKSKVGEGTVITLTFPFDKNLNNGKGGNF